jgi:hypothetical protein
MIEYILIAAATVSIAATISCSIKPRFAEVPARIRKRQS